MFKTEKRDFKKGDIIVFCDEEYEVMENYGTSGKVKENYPNGTVIDTFYWVYGNSECTLKEK